MNEDKINSVFVCGKNRSGTKWLSNILLNHKDLSGIQSEFHTGILESNILNNINRVFGDLSRPDNYIGFAEWFFATDFFRISGVDKKFLYKKKSSSYYGFFREFMNEQCRKKNSAGWLQKIHSLKLEKIYHYFKESKFIIIERGLIDSISSAYFLGNRHNRRLPLMRETFEYSLIKKIHTVYAKKDNVFVVKFEVLKKNSPHEVRKICDFLGISYSARLLVVKFRKNTSYVSGKRSFGFWTKMKIRMVYRFFSLIPLVLQKYIYNFYQRFKGNNSTENSYIIAGSFSESYKDYTDL